MTNTTTPTSFKTRIGNIVLGTATVLSVLAVWPGLYFYALIQLPNN